jgi:hypothetical protein
MKKLRVKTIVKNVGGEDYPEIMYLDPYGDWGAGGGTTCGGSQKGTCPRGYYCVCYQWTDPGCGLERQLNGTCGFLSCECI